MDAMSSTHELPTLVDLRIFVEVVRSGSLTGAARRLSYTQSAISRRIAALEGSTGVSLLERLPRGVRATPAGETLHGHCVEILARVETAAHELDAIASGQGGRLRVGAFPTANAALVPAALARLRRSSPDIGLELIEGLTRTLLDQLRAGAIDVAVVSDYPAGLPGRTGLRFTEIMRDPLLVALPRQHQLADKPMLRLRDLTEETWIDGSEPGQPTALTIACARAGFTPRVDLQVREWMGKQGFVAAGLGVTLVPTLAAPAVRSDLVLCSLGRDAPVRVVFAALPDNCEPLPAALTFVDLLQSTAAEHHQPAEDAIAPPEADAN
jgi:DNA-binding transcriptional LysR family regulator